MPYRIRGTFPFAFLWERLGKYVVGRHRSLSGRCRAGRSGPAWCWVGYSTQRLGTARLVHSSGLRERMSRRLRGVVFVPVQRTDGMVFVPLTRRQAGLRDGHFQNGLLVADHQRVVSSAGQTVLLLSIAGKLPRLLVSKSGHRTSALLLQDRARSRSPSAPLLGRHRCYVLVRLGLSLGLRACRVRPAAARPIRFFEHWPKVRLGRAGLLTAFALPVRL